MKYCRKFLIGLPVVLLLAACSESPRPAEKKEPPKPPEPIGALSAMTYAIGYARTNWTPDIQILSVRSLRIEGIENRAGKAAAWEFQLVSDRLRRARGVTYAVEEGGGQLHKGVFAGLEQAWRGPSGQTTPFLIQAFKVDSTAAYETAIQQKQAIAYSQKNPGMPVTFVLEKTKRHPNPAWRVIWGDSAMTSNFSVFVDATTGKYLETMR